MSFLTSSLSNKGGLDIRRCSRVRYFSAVLRDDALARGVINHPLCLTVPKSRPADVAPASHFANRETNPDLLRMGERFRLKASFATRSGG
jgi:hypothetical protein